ncbi:MAG: hypothetical protein ACLQK4_06530 [Acidimicrobiales bacterium]
MIERDRLNFYSPHERLPAGHENQLTRALLLLLRMSPIVHVEWLRLAAPGRSLAELPPADYDTQRRAVRAAADEEEQAELISVFLAPERPQSGGGAVAESDRGQVLDAIVDYGGELIVVIENKIYDADDLQARELNLTGARIALADRQEAVVILWRDLLEALIALRERDLVAGAEARLLDDFLAYVEDHFPDLGPFRHLALCQGVASRQTRRLRQVLGEAAGVEASGNVYGPWIPTPAGDVAGANAYLRIADHHVESGAEVELALFPADTLSQARGFYANPAAVEGLRKLAATDGWKAGPNFHFGHMQRGYCWTTSSIELGAYLDLWQDQIEHAHAVAEDEWDSYWQWLEQQQIATPGDRPEFDRHFTDTARSTAFPRPGLWLARRWPLADAEHLDVRGALALQVRDALDTALRALTEPPLQTPGL